MSRILLGVTGSVAAVKTPEFFAALTAEGHEVRVAPTSPALTFFDGAVLTTHHSPLTPPDPLTVRGQTTVYLDEDEWPKDRLFEVGEPVLHIELRRWAEVLVIAPLDANTLAKLALGLCDNLLTCVYRAWDLTRPVVLAPAMNTLMWEHPATRRQLAQVEADLGPALKVVQPQAKVLACGDEGMGGMAPVADLVRAVAAAAQASPITR